MQYNTPSFVDLSLNAAICYDHGGIYAFIKVRPETAITEAVNKYGKLPKGGFLKVATTGSYYDPNAQHQIIVY